MKNKILKVMTWRGISIIITLCVMYVMTSDIRSATGITVFLHTLLTAGHFVFETLWERSNESQ